MISPTKLQQLASGERRGLGAAATRAVLRAAAAPYGAAVRLRNWRYDHGASEVFRASAPVISVGNLTVGGTGKTPVVQWTARHLRSSGVRVAILSRGYRADQDGVNDEALELELSLPDVPHLQNPDRCHSAKIAVEELAAQTLLLDDGFQHRRLRRDLDLVLLDATAPFGYDHLLPRGMLREPISGLARADVVMLSRAGMVDSEGRVAIRQRAAKLAPRALWCETTHRARKLLATDGKAESLEIVRDRPVYAFCGIGNPAGFRHTLQTLGCRLVEFREFPDHHAYRSGDVAGLAESVKASGAVMALCTRKDLVKLRVESLEGAPLRAVDIGIEFLAGQEELEAVLDQATASARLADR